MHDDHPDNSHNATSYGAYVLVWLTLLVLTAVTVTAAGVRVGKLNVITALAVASVKSALVLSWFMHLRDEPPLLRWFFLIAVGTLAIFIGMTFFDISFRVAP